MQSDKIPARNWLPAPVKTGLVMGSVILASLTPAPLAVAGRTDLAAAAVVRSHAAIYRATIPASTFSEGVLIDPTLSTATGFSSSAEQIISSVLSSWPGPPVPTTTTGPTVPQPGIQAYVRQVETNSFDSSNPSFYIAIPAVPGLKHRPNAAAPNFLSQDPTWIRARAQVANVSELATNVANQGATEVANWQLEAWQNSEIYGGVSALAETMPSGPKRIVVWSDLEQNEAPQVAGNLRQAAVLVVQPCNDTAATCQGYAASFKSFLKSLGASSIQFIRPEDAAQAVPAFMKETS